jgi:hypothetical protein
MSTDTPQPPPPPDELVEAHELLMALLDGDIDAAQITRLDELVCRNDRVLRLYSIYVHQQCVIAAMARPVALADRQATQLDDSMHESMVLDAIRSDEQPVREEAVYLPQRPPPPPPPTISERFREASLSMLGSAMKYRPPARWAAIFLLGLVGLLVVLMLQRPAHRGSSPPTVVAAKLSHEIGAKWEAAAPTGELPINTALSLTAGYAEFTFTGGAKVVVEAPARFTLKGTGQIALASGKLAAMVPPPARGFTVNTPQSTVTDLGTEFGVAVNPVVSTTQVDVFKGQVTAQSLIPSSPPVKLVEGNTATVTPVGTRTTPTGAMPQRFVRTLETQRTNLDLVDMLCGGDGTTHRRGFSIDPRNGDYGKFATRSGPGNLYGDNLFHPAKLLPIVGGCFIPNGTTQIDPAGNHFDFTKTHGDTYDFIRAGGPVEFPSPPPFSAVLGGVDYLAADHALLFLHSNVGLTLDLSAVRRLHPGNNVVRFHAKIGNSAPSHDVDNKEIKPIPADAYAFVDGAARFEKRGFTNADGAFEIDLPLTDTDRFLTLAACTHSDSAADNTIWFNWIVVGDAEFDLTTPAISATSPKQ